MSGSGGIVGARPVRAQGGQGAGASRGRVGPIGNFSFRGEHVSFGLPLQFDPRLMNVTYPLPSETGFVGDPSPVQGNQTHYGMFLPSLDKKYVYVGSPGQLAKVGPGKTGVILIDPMMLGLEEEVARWVDSMTGIDQGAEPSVGRGNYYTLPVGIGDGFNYQAKLAKLQMKMLIWRMVLKNYPQRELGSSSITTNRIAEDGILIADFIDRELRGLGNDVGVNLTYQLLRDILLNDGIEEKGTTEILRAIGSELSSRRAASDQLLRADEGQTRGINLFTIRDNQDQVPGRDEDKGEDDEPIGDPDAEDVDPVGEDMTGIDGVEAPSEGENELIETPGEGGSTDEAKDPDLDRPTVYAADDAFADQITDGLAPDVAEEYLKFLDELVDLIEDEDVLIDLNELDDGDLRLAFGTERVPVINGRPFLMDLGAPSQVVELFNEQDGIISLYTFSLLMNSTLLEGLPVMVWISEGQPQNFLPIVQGREFEAYEYLVALHTLIGERFHQVALEEPEMTLGQIMEILGPQETLNVIDRLLSKTGLGETNDFFSLSNDTIFAEFREAYQRSQSQAPGALDIIFESLEPGALSGEKTEAIRARFSGDGEARLAEILDGNLETLVARLAEVEASQFPPVSKADRQAEIIEDIERLDDIPYGDTTLLVAIHRDPDVNLWDFIFGLSRADTRRIRDLTRVNFDEPVGYRIAQDRNWPAGQALPVPRDRIADFEVTQLVALLRDDRIASAPQLLAGLYRDLNLELPARTNNPLIDALNHDPLLLGWSEIMISVGDREIVLELRRIITGLIDQGVLTLLPPLAADQEIPEGVDPDQHRLNLVRFNYELQIEIYETLIGLVEDQVPNQTHVNVRFVLAELRLRIAAARLALHRDQTGVRVGQEVRDRAAGEFPLAALVGEILEVHYRLTYDSVFNNNDIFSRLSNFSRGRSVNMLTGIDWQTPGLITHILDHPPADIDARSWQNFLTEFFKDHIKDNLIPAGRRDEVLDIVLGLLDFFVRIIDGKDTIRPQEVRVLNDLLEGAGFGRLVVYRSHMVQLRDGLLRVRSQILDLALIQQSDHIIELSQAHSRIGDPNLVAAMELRLGQVGDRWNELARLAKREEIDFRQDRSDWENEVGQRRDEILREHFTDFIFPIVDDIFRNIDNPQLSDEVKREVIHEYLEELQIVLELYGFDRISVPDEAKDIRLDDVRADLERLRTEGIGARRVPLGVPSPLTAERLFEEWLFVSGDLLRRLQGEVGEVHPDLMAVCDHYIEGAIRMWGERNLDDRGPDTREEFARFLEALLQIRMGQVEEGDTTVSIGGIPFRANQPGQARLALQIYGLLQRSYPDPEIVPERRRILIDPRNFTGVDPSDHWSNLPPITMIDPLDGGTMVHPIWRGLIELLGWTVFINPIPNTTVVIGLPNSTRPPESLPPVDDAGEGSGAPGNRSRTAPSGNSSSNGEQGSLDPLTPSVPQNPPLENAAQAYGTPSSDPMTHDSTGGIVQGGSEMVDPHAARMSDGDDQDSNVVRGPSSWFQRAADGVSSVTPTPPTEAESTGPISTTSISPPLEAPSVTDPRLEGLLNLLRDNDLLAQAERLEATLASPETRLEGNDRLHRELLRFRARLDVILGEWLELASFQEDDITALAQRRIAINQGLIDFTQNLTGLDPAAIQILSLLLEIYSPFPGHPLDLDVNLVRVMLHILNRSRYDEDDLFDFRGLVGLQVDDFDMGFVGPVTFNLMREDGTDPIIQSDFLSRWVVRRSDQQDDLRRMLLSLNRDTLVRTLDTREARYRDDIGIVDPDRRAEVIAFGQSIFQMLGDGTLATPAGRTLYNSLFVPRFDISESIRDRMDAKLEGIEATYGISGLDVPGSSLREKTIYCLKFYLLEFVNNPDTQYESDQQRRMMRTALIFMIDWLDGHVDVGRTSNDRELMIALGAIKIGRLEAGSVIMPDMEGYMLFLADGGYDPYDIADWAKEKYVGDRLNAVGEEEAWKEIAGLEQRRGYHEGFTLVEYLLPDEPCDIEEYIRLLRLTPAEARESFEIEALIKIAERRGGLSADELLQLVEALGYPVQVGSVNTREELGHLFATVSTESGFSYIATIRFLGEVYANFKRVFGETTQMVARVGEVQQRLRTTLDQTISRLRSAYTTFQSEHAFVAECILAYIDSLPPYEGFDDRGFSISAARHYFNNPSITIHLKYYYEYIELRNGIFIEGNQSYIPEARSKIHEILGSVNDYNKNSRYMRRMARRVVLDLLSPQLSVNDLEESVQINSLRDLIELHGLGSRSSSYIASVIVGLSQNGELDHVSQELIRDAVNIVRESSVSVPRFSDLD